ncbi:Golgi CORVET complex core vacuolar protein 8-domain-containing protein [Dipodascopsis tothii]|uniref:Golgi CORVET complex core vacuolar protein 8-domain-containing protein n=1 Tax=Dipodascopsis tothii TaxID=44089 RepID=UPI0034CF890D
MSSIASTDSVFTAGPVRPFDRRFHTRLQSPSYASLRSSSPAPSVARSRISSISTAAFDEAFDHLPSDEKMPWEVVRWTKLRKLSSQVYSESGRQSYGTPTCITIAASIAVGTSRGYVLVFDYNQNMLYTLGMNIKAEAGAVTALAFTADYTHIASGHERGHVFVWRVSKPLTPRFHLVPVPADKAGAREGHVDGAAVLHVGFLGKRHTAVVSADDRGMAFAHINTTQLMQKSMQTTRLLGRYPAAPGRGPGKPRKATSVLAFGTLAPGNTPHATDVRGLVAIMTPHLLVIISTSPVPQTQFKTSRPKTISDTMGLSGCLDWFPTTAPRALRPREKEGPVLESENPRLAYCWSNVVTIVGVTVRNDPKSRDGTGKQMDFNLRKRYVADEAIVALQWLNSQMILLVTITQRLLVLNEASMTATETEDLIPRQLMRHDYFSAQLHDLVITAADGGEHYATIPDAFFNSFRTFKSRIFLLGSYEFAVGQLSSWAERLLSLMEAESFVDAIRLAIKYYKGETDQITIGLPEDEQKRHATVYDTLVDMILTALRYSLSDSVPATPAATEEEHMSHYDERFRYISELAEVCFEACYVADAEDVLFEGVYECFETANKVEIFFETLEAYILTEKIAEVPPEIVKQMISMFSSLNLNERLEDVICHLEPTSFDIDQVTTMCRSHELYDALIYVWNQSLGDYVAPMTDFVAMIRRYNAGGDEAAQRALAANISKVYTYISYIFTGRVYPTGQYIDDADADRAKAALYYFLFVGTPVVWPRQGGHEVRTTDGDEPPFPYLRLLLGFDAPNFVVAMNEAFEDAFLNEAQSEPGADDDTAFGRSVTRQYVVNTLLDVMSKDFTAKDTIYLDMLVARNLAKYPQFIMLSGTLMKNVLMRLCAPPRPELADDCQLSIEYLLSVYKPPNVDELIAQFVDVKYYRVLKWIFRAEKRYAKLIQAYFDDEDGPNRDDVFGCIDECLGPRSALTERQRRDVRDTVAANYERLVRLDPARAADLVDRTMPDLHAALYDRLRDARPLQLVYLRTLFEREFFQDSPAAVLARKLRAPWNTQQARETYISLLCEHDSARVIHFLRYLQKGDVRLSMVLSALEAAGVIDGEIFLLRSEGQYAEAIKRLTMHLDHLRRELLGLFPEEQMRGRRKSAGLTRRVVSDEKRLAETQRQLQQYVIFGVRLCSERTAKGRGARRVKPDGSGGSVLSSGSSVSDKDALTEPEATWLELIDAVVALTQDVSAALVPEAAGQPDTAAYVLPSTRKTVVFLRRLVQDVFSALLVATSSASSVARAGRAADSPTPAAGGSLQPSVSFLHILEAFLDRAAAGSPSLANLRSVLANVFEAYVYERQLLSLTNRLLNRDLMVHVTKVYDLRKQGWKIQSSGKSGPGTCEGCGRKAWGSAAPADVYWAWERKRKVVERRRRQRFPSPGGDDAVGALLRGDDAAPVAAVTVGRHFDEPRDEPREPRGRASRRRRSASSSSSSSDDDDDDETIVPLASSSSSTALPAHAVPEPPKARTIFLKPGEDYGYDDDDELDAPAGERAWTPAGRAPAHLRAGEMDSLVVFRCGHTYHRMCIEKLVDGSRTRQTGAGLGQALGQAVADGRKDVGEGYECIICQ